LTIAVAVAGGNGRMGRAVAQCVGDSPVLRLAVLTLPAGSQPEEPLLAGRERYTHDLDAALASAQVLIDFTTPSALAAHAAACRRHDCAWVLGTTGMDAGQQALVNDAAAQVPVCQAANFSRGVTLLLDLLQQVAAAMDDETDVEIVEAHHRHKRDAPSGTALAMGEAIARGRGGRLEELRTVHQHGLGEARRRGTIGFASLRAGDIVGEHTALFAADGERLEITHRASSRRAFASGACRAAEWLVGRAPGLYNMQDVMNLRNED
jgi:4-hydroxy-tetrahydrodipicolinate reductase